MFVGSDSQLGQQILLDSPESIFFFFFYLQVEEPLSCCRSINTSAFESQCILCVIFKLPLKLFREFDLCV